MEKYKYVITCYDGEILDSADDGEIFDTYEDADEAALYALSCMQLGGEILHMSNPGDYPYDEDDYNDNEYEIVEIDDEE